MNVPELHDIDPVTEDLIVRTAARHGLSPELLQAACEAAYGSPVEETDDIEEMARALKVFAGRHEAMVRARVADSVEVAPVCEADRPFMGLLARSIRGEDVSKEVTPGGQIVERMPEIERRVRARVAEEIMRESRGTYAWQTAIETAAAIARGDSDA